MTRRHLSFGIVVAAILCMIPFSHARGFKSLGEMQKIIVNMSEELRSPFAKAGVQTIVAKLHFARISLHPHNYEQKSRYKDNFLPVYQDFQRLLWTGDLKKISAKALKRPKDLERMFGAYQENRDDFMKFIEKLPQKTDWRSLNRVVFFKYVDQPTIEKSQLYFATILLGGDSDRWGEAWKFSYLWSICFSANR